MPSTAISFIPKTRTRPDTRRTPKKEKKKETKEGRMDRQSERAKMPFFRGKTEPTTRRDATNMGRRRRGRDSSRTRGEKKFLGCRPDDGKEKRKGQRRCWGARTTHQSDPLWPHLSRIRLDHHRPKLELSREWDWTRESGRPQKGGEAEVDVAEGRGSGGIA